MSPEMASSNATTSALVALVFQRSSSDASSVSAYGALSFTPFG
jgi:hypothetical protein